MGNEQGRGPNGTPIPQGGNASASSVKEVDLSNKGLTEVPVELLRYRGTIEILGLSRNRVGDARILAEMQRLRRLDLSWNGMQRVDNEVFLLRDLEVLDLSHNELPDLNVLVSNLMFLRELNVSFNRITEITPLIARCISLQSLNLANNKITVIPPEMCTMASLVKLILNDNQITELPDQIGALTSLSLLNLSENSIRKLPSGIGKLSGLMKLYIDNNELEELGPSIGALVSLREINMRSNQLTSLPRSLGNLTCLTICDLGDNPWDSPEYTQKEDVRELLAFVRQLPETPPAKNLLAPPKHLSKQERRNMSMSVKRGSTGGPVAQAEPGFHFVETAKRLLHVKGIGKRLIALPADITFKSLNDGDAFIFDTVDIIYVWLGRKSNRDERAKAAHLAKLLKAEAGDHPKIAQIENGVKSPHESQFWTDLGDKGPITKEGGDDSSALDATFYFKLFSIREGEDGRMTINVVVGEGITKSILTSDSCFVLDDGCDIWVWTGTYSSANEKSWAFLKAEELERRGHRPACASIRWALEGVEPVLFIEHFQDWADNSWALDEKEKLKQEQELAKEQEQRSREEAEYQRFLIEREKEMKAYKQRIKSNPPPELSMTPQSPSPTPASMAPPTRKPPFPREDDIDLPVAVAKPPERRPPSQPEPETEGETESEYEDEDVVVAPEPIKASVPAISVSPQTSVLAASVVAQAVEATVMCPICSHRVAPTKFCSNCGKLLPKSVLAGAGVAPAVPTPTGIAKVSPRQEAAVTAKAVSPAVVPAKSATAEVTKPVEAPKPSAASVVQLKPEVSPEIPKHTSPSPTPPVVTEAKKERDSPAIVVTPAAAVAQPTPAAEPKKIQTEADLIAQVEAEMAAEGKVRRKKRLPTKNPLRDRKEKAAEAAAVSALEPKKPEASKAASVIGGYGLLYSVKAEEFLFAKKREETDFTRKALENSTLAPKDLPRLYHVKGRRRPFARQVERSWKSLNSGDCFIADEGKFGKFIYQWNGRDANRIEKGKAMDLAKNLRDKERFNSKVVTIEEGRETPEFWAAIGGSPNGPIADKVAGGDDEEAERAYMKHVVLYKAVLGEGDNVNLERVSEEGRSLVKAILFPGNCYVLDCVSEVYAWTSTQVNSKHRQGTVKRAEAIAADREKQCWVAPVYHEWSGSEQIMFRERFVDWNSVPISVSTPNQSPAHQRTGSRPATTKVNVAKMYATKPEKEEIMVDDGTGKVKVFLVEEFKRVPLPDDSVGEFFSGDSYVILYTYVWKNKDCYLIYFWQGRSSSIIGKGTSAALTIDLDEKLKKTASMSKEVRVVQGKEPKHFLTVFKQKFIVHSGRDPRSGVAESDKKSVRLYHVKGTDEFSTRAIQTACTAQVLHSSNVFIATRPGKVAYVWHGRFCNQFERAFAATAVQCSTLKCEDCVNVEEGREPEGFWIFIGGRMPYPTESHARRCDARLFQCSVGSGAFVVEEVQRFAQDDLAGDDVMILDAFNQVYVWIGGKSHPDEQRLSLETAQEYTAYAGTVDKRPVPTPMLRVLDNSEPYVFTVHFHGWEQSRKYGRASQSAEQQARSFDGGLVPVATVLQEYTRKYTYEELLNKQYPKGIDETNLETFLDDAEFATLFKMSRAEFAKLPLWQRQNLKRELRLW